MRFFNEREYSWTEWMDLLLQYFMAFKKKVPSAPLHVYRRYVKEPREVNCFLKCIYEKCRGALGYL